MIDMEGKATGGRYYFIDALDIGQYLIYEDDQFRLGEFSKEWNEEQKKDP